MRKILIATPLRGDIPSYYNKMLIELFCAKIPDIKFAHVYLGGCSVQWARDELAALCLRDNLDEIVFWDKDVKPTMTDWMTLLSRDADVVCGIYSRRGVDTYWHLVGDSKNQETRPDGLMRVEKCAIGFSKIKVSVFRRLKEFFPERVYWRADGGAEPAQLQELFPMGIRGPNSYEGKLKRIRAAINSKDAMGHDKADALTMTLIRQILADADYSTNQVRGEDFYFCEICQEAGIPVYADPSLIISHTGEMDAPIPTAKLFEMLREPWRQDEVRALRAVAFGPNDAGLNATLTEEIVPT